MPPLASRRLRRFYYRVKPHLPRSVRWALRRRHARRIRRTTGGFWPIDPAAGAPPPGWTGWPDGREFAFVLTHDVESRAGLERVRPLAELEMELGFRSSFNFVPEGDYQVSAELRRWLVDHGFEVGIHDLKHDGYLYNSRNRFARSAERINHYAREWDAAGFRSAFMLRELEWLHDLDVLYDASTFDTDPFEPQPDGVHTIFPFWLPRSPEDSAKGYVELPYTLPQDSTLFLLLGETSPRIWKEKLAWIAKKGGMAMPIVHPDYIRLGDGVEGPEMYPAGHYRDFLRHVKESYGGRYWHALPKDVAQFVASARESLTKVLPPGNGQASAERPKIWIDLDNTPHVPFFEPIVEELESRGFPVMLTARDAFQVCSLAEKKGMKFRKVGRHHGKNMLMKGAGLGYRALQLLPMVARERPVIGVSHGARSQLLVGNLINMPT
ncbi:MAG: DUF354 domain-containing protein, partial [Akkermansiaceae bacterium]|nr:DUF354 domain-containing protein [Akkermansiaceae bacterium]